MLVPWESVAVRGKTHGSILCEVPNVSTLYCYLKFSIHLKLLGNKLLFETTVSIAGQKSRKDIQLCYRGHPTQILLIKSDHANRPCRISHVLRGTVGRL